MLFNKAFILPVAIVASSVFTSAHKSRVAPKVESWDLLNAFALFEVAQRDLINDQRQLSTIVKAPAPSTAQVVRELGKISQVMDNLKHDLANPPEIDEPEMFEVSRSALTQANCSYALGEIINVLVTSVTTVYQLETVEKPMHDDLSHISDATLQTLKYSTDTLRVTSRELVKSHIANYKQLAVALDGFSQIAVYLET